MFKKILLCHDGTDGGRRALKQGAHLAITLQAEIHVLVIGRSAGESASVAAAQAGYSSFAMEVDYPKILAESISRLDARGVKASGHLAYGDVIPQIHAHSKRLGIDLIVVGHYPSAPGRRWWSGNSGATLSDTVGCSVLIAIDR